jgi:hypothetical protein
LKEEEKAKKTSFDFYSFLKAFIKFASLTSAFEKQKK